MQAATPDMDGTPPPTIWRQVILVILVATGTVIVLATFFFASFKSPQLGWDFPQFYIAAKLPMRLIYNPVAFKAFGHENLASRGVLYYPLYIRPSAFVAFFRPLGRFDYWTAFCIWAGLGLCAYFASIILLIRRLDLPEFLIPAYASFFPAIVGLISGQDVCVVLLVIVGAWLLLEGKRDWLAGALIALGLYKFNLILLLPLLLIIKRRFRALISFGIAAVLLMASSAALASPREYLNLLIDSPKLTPGLWEVGLIGFSRAIGLSWFYPVLAIIVFVLCCWLMTRLPLPESFCVAIVGMLLISPHIAWYDSTLLALPIAVVFARSNTAIRICCFALLIAYPLWRYGGGNNGPIGFTHVTVELFILGYFILDVRRGSRTGHPSEPVLITAAT